MLSLNCKQAGLELPKKIKYERMFAMKKFFALVLTLAMCICMLAVAPVVSAAADSSLWENGYANGYRAKDNVVASEGFERVYVDGNYLSRQVTKSSYDLTETTIVLRDVHLVGGHWGSMVFNNTKVGSLANTDASNGVLSFLIRGYDDKLKFTVYTGVESTSFEVPLADEYEISFIKTTSGKGRMRVNNTYFDNDTYITPFINSGLSSYIAMGSDYQFGASYKFVNNDSMNNRWVANQNRLLTPSGAIVTDNAATSLRTTSGYRISSLPRYNLLENTFVLDNAEIAADSNWNLFTFSTNREVTYSSDAPIWFFITPNLDANKEIVSLKISLALNIGSDVTVPAAQKYEIRFINIAGSYHMYINETRITNYADSAAANVRNFSNRVKEFCTNGSVQGCYINLMAANYMTADMTVAENDSYKGKWINTSGSMYHNVDGDASDTMRQVTASNAISTIASYDLLHGKFTLKGAKMSANKDHYNVITFAAINGPALSVASNQWVCTILAPEKITDGVIETLSVQIINASGAWVKLGTVAAADDYIFNFTKESGKHYLYVNGNKMEYNGIFDILANAGALENCYITLFSANYLKATPVFSFSSWEQVGKVTTANWSASISDDEAAEKVSFVHDAYIRQVSKFDIRKTSVVIDGLSIAEYTDSESVSPNNFNKSAVLVLAKNDKITGPVVATTDGLTFIFRYIKNGDGEFIQVFNVHNGGGWESLGTVSAADSYNISVVYSQAKGYTLKINGTVMSAIKYGDATKFFESAGDDVYVLLGAQQTTVNIEKIAIEETNAICGDVNGDEVRDIVDMVMVARGMADDNNDADADQNGDVNDDDISAIRKIWFLDGLRGFAYAQ